MGPMGPMGPMGRRVLLLNLAAEVGIVVSGGLVRLTGSGLGCPSWPECTTGSMVPVADQPEGVHRLVEFGNRLLTFGVLVAAVAALLVVAQPWLASRGTPLVGRGTPGRVHRPLLWLAIAVLAGIFGQAVLGGVTVLVDLNPALVAAHFLLSMAMVAAAFVLYRRSGDAGDRPVALVVRRELRGVAGAIVVVAICVLMLGTIVTGSGPHSGDADEAIRFSLDPRLVSWLHADVVLVLLGLTAAFALGTRLTDAPQRAQRAGMLLGLAILIQGAIGYTQYFTDLPIGLVSLHMLCACLVWIAAIEVLLSTHRRG
jgi:cytochrome c oxidase assembly protein subunit 15